MGPSKASERPGPIIIRGVRTRGWRITDRANILPRAA
jgi:hypothetical protein